MTTIWRLHANTDSDDEKKISGYMLNEHIMAIGWSLKDSHLRGTIKEEDMARVCKERNDIKTIDDYDKFCYEYKIYKNGVNANVRRFTREIEEGDLIWIRNEGIYYLGRFGSESTVGYYPSKENLENDACIQISNIDWIPIGDESVVPGAVTTALISRLTFCRISLEGVEEFSKFIYDKVTGENFYEDKELTFNQEKFYNFISPTDCEDLLCMYLYKKYGYLVIPSTNKKSTELYECVLLDTKTGKNIFIQVKKGEDPLKPEDYFHLDGDVYLLTTKGKVKNYDKEKHKNITVVDPEELFNYITDEDFQNYLPQSIKYWIELFGGYKKN